MKEKNRSFSALKMALAVAFAAIASPVMAEDIDADLNKSTTLLNGETQSNNLTSALNSEVGNDDLLTQNGINSSGTTILPNGETLQLSLDGIDTGMDNSKNIPTNNLTSAKTPSKTTSTRMVAKLTSPVKLANTPTVYTPTLDRVNATSSTIINDTEGLRPTYELVTSKPSGDYVEVNINGTTYYYVPDTTTYKLSDLQNLANTGSVALTKDTMGKAMYKLPDGTLYYYNKEKLPTSSYEVTAGTSTDYNFVTYTKDEEGKTVPNYYKIILSNRIGTSENITWSTDGTGATGSVSVQLPNETTARKLYYTVDESKYGKLHTTTADRVINPTSDVGSADSPDLFKGIAYSSGGGAISNTANNNKNIYGDFIGNRSSYHGGAIYNTGKLNSIIGDFINNASKQASKYYGGAIYNASNSTINSITGDFVGNSSYDLGGAISNGGSIAEIKGNFISNSCTGAKMGKGGAIWNSLTIKNGNKIGTITGDFIGNYTDWIGGAIANTDTISNITGDFIGNYLKSGADTGGAIMNYAGGIIGNINGDFIGNHINNSNYGYGSAICNDDGATINNITGNFIGNYAQVSSTVNGSAIHNTGGSITLNANTQDILFSGNYTAKTDGSNKVYNDIYNQNSSTTKLSTLNLTSSNGHKISFDGGITGNGTTNILAGTEVEFTNVNSKFQQGKINIGDGVTLNIQNGGNQTINNIAIGGEGTTVNLDIDFFDKISGSSQGGKININSIGLKGVLAGDYNQLTSNLTEYIDNTSWSGAKLIDNENGITSVSYSKRGSYGVLTAFSDEYTFVDAVKNINAADQMVFEMSKDVTLTSSITTNCVPGHPASYELTINGKDKITQEKPTVSGNGYIYVSNGTILSLNDIVFSDMTTQAIYNSYSAKITNISADFVNNSYSSSGGAIYNSGTIDNITGNFTNNHVQSSYSGSGGAIYNSGTIGDITSDFIGNYTNPTSTTAYGGAIYNYGTISSITGKADKNGNIIAFKENFIKSDSDSTKGGAIYNDGSYSNVTIGNITGDFIDNYAEGKTASLGGAIYTIGKVQYDVENPKSVYNYKYTYSNSDTGASTVGYTNSTTIAKLQEEVDKGNKFLFSNYEYNYSYTTAEWSKGKSVYAYDSNGTYHSAKVYSVAEAQAFFEQYDATTSNTDLFKNYEAIVVGKTDTIGTIRSSFSGNYAKSQTAEAKGGAIYSESNIYIKADQSDITISDNYAQGVTAQGGAIWSGEGSIVDLTADGHDIIFSGNYTANADGSNKVYNDIYNQGATSTINLTSSNGHKISFDGGITGDGTTNVADGTTLAFTNANSTFEQGSINLGEDVTFDLLNSKDQNFTVKGLNLTTGAKLNLNMDFNDTINDFNNPTATGGVIDLTMLNLSKVIAGDESVISTTLSQYFTGKTFADGELVGKSGAIGDVVLEISGNNVILKTSVFDSNLIATLDKMHVSSKKLINDPARTTYTLSSDKTEGAVAVTIDGTTKYFTPTSNVEKWQNLANTGSAALSKVEVGTGVGTPVYTDGTYDYFYDTAKLPTSVYELAKGTSTDYNFIKYSKDESGELVPNYYKIELDGSRLGTSKNITWSTNPTGSTNPNNPIEVQIPNPTQESGTETISLYYTLNNDTYTKLLNGKTGTSKNITWSNDGTGATGSVEVQLLNEASKRTLYYKVDETKYGNVWKEHKDNPDNIGTKDSPDLFIGASTSSSGGAIYNTANNNINIYADFVGNSSSGYGYEDGGGAIYNDSNATIGNITGDFIGNSASGSGGAIFNNYPATIGNITGDFIGNSASGGGGAITNRYGIISSITGDFIGNYASSSGGAIYNTEDIYNLTGDFIGNYVLSSSFADGGAIYSGDTISNITGDFIGNYASSTSADARGGAIHNSCSRISGITGDFIGNYATTTSTSYPAAAYGGAIYNTSGTIGDITGDFIGNYANGSNYNVDGGAIANNAEINNITGDFIGNYVLSSYFVYGGAIYNGPFNWNDTIINNIIGDFIGNHANSPQLYAYGGAIANDSNATIGNITGDFIGNYALGSYSAYGGAIYNYATIGNITGDFIGNHANATIQDYGPGYYAEGGAICNRGTISNITGNFINNYVLCSDAQGGAINNDGTISNISGDFIGNYTQGTDAKGGAIHNTGSGKISSITGDFIDNYAQGTNAKGGAIYNGFLYSGNNSTITLNANGKNITFFGNWVGPDADHKTYNDIHNENYDATNIGTLNLTSSNGHKISFDGGITGDGTTNVVDGTTLAFTNANSTFEQGSINIQNAQSGASQGVIIDLMNGTTQDFSIKGLVLNSDTKLDLNIDFYDQINGTASGAGLFDITSINLANISAGVDSIISTTLSNYFSEQTFRNSALINKDSSIGKVKLVIENGNVILRTSLKDITLLGTLDKIYDASEGIINDPSRTTYTLSSDKTEGSVAVTIDGTTKYFTPTSNVEKWQNLANTGSAALSKVEVGTGVGTPVYTDGTYDYFYDTAKLPTSVYELAKGTSTDYNFIKYSKDESGELVPNYYKIELDGSRVGTSKNITWSTNPTGSTNPNNPIEVQIPNPTKESGTETISLYYTLNNDTYTKLLNGKTGTSKNITWSNDGTGATGSVEVQLLNEASKRTLYYKVDESKYGNVWKEQQTNPGNIGSADKPDLFIGAKIQGTGQTVAGGAIYNTQTGGDIYADFVGNYAENTYTGSTSSSKYAYGGAIYNTGTLGNITGDFINNYTKTNANSYYTYTYGDAIYNSGTIGNITGDFIGNYVLSSSFAYGGAIYNDSNATIGDITGDFIGNHDGSSYSSTDGGAIYNKGTIGDITGDFIGNSAGDNGGAIYNDSNATIGDITGDFVGNNASTSYSSTDGGAIYNKGTIGDITGDFIGNHGGMYGGAIYNNSNATIGDITGDFIGNHGGMMYGGAIYNASTIDYITGDFIGNSTGTCGGAIYNVSTIDYITGDFIGNTSYYGGAIYNYSYNGNAKIGNITGDFIGNSTGDYYGDGGAISNFSTINSITGDFIGNNAIDTGGAIYNQGTIGNITGDFIGNSAGDNGGAIYNYSYNGNAKIGNITGDFIGNTSYYGGAIYNDNGSTIGSITGDFIGNSSYGAIYNDNGSTIGSITGDFIGNSGFYTIYNTNNSRIGNITGDFIGNSGSEVIFNISGGTIDNIKGNFIDNNGGFAGAIEAVDTINNIEGNFIRNTGALAGAIDLQGGTINNIKGNFTDNHGAFGGAIGNTMGIAIGNITGNFTSNSSSYSAGAIYNGYGGTIGNITGTFIDNYAQGTDAKGGAIYNAGEYSGNGTITLNANTQDILFSGNWVGPGADHKTYNDIHNANYDATNIGTLNLTSSNGHKISFDGGITGDGTTNVVDGTTLAFTNEKTTFEQGTINIQQATSGESQGVIIDLQNGTTQNFSIKGLVLNSDTKLDLNIDFYDQINGTASGAGKINIATIDVTGVGVGATNELTTSLANYIANSSWSGAKLVGEVGIDAVTFSKNGDVGILSAVTANFGDIIVNTFGKDKAAFQMSQDETLATALTTNSAAGHPATYELTINGKDAQTGTNHTITGKGITVANGTTLSLKDMTFDSMTASSGGAIFNKGTIGDITGDFTENKANSSSKTSYGGAIYNIATIGDITGTFSSNSTTTKLYTPGGGAIYNSGTIDSITGTEKIIDGKTVNVAFINNYVQSGTAANGGAIYNHAGTIGTITGDFIGNHASSTGSGTSTMHGALGGAIANTGTIENIVDSNFINNYSQGHYRTYSGAIYNSANGTITITSLNKDVTFSGNYSADETGSNKAYNDIVNKNILNLASSEGHKISFDGGILGDIDDATLGTTNIADGTTLAFTNAKTTFEQGTINIQNAQSGENKGVVIDLMNGTTQDFSIKGLVLNTDTKLNLNVDFLDQINGTASGAGKINIATINVAGVEAGTTNVLTTSLANYINNTTWSGSQLANNFETDIKSVTLDKATGTFTAVGLTFAEALRNELPKAERNYKLLSGETLASGISTNSASGHPAKYTLNVDGNNQTVTGKGFTVSSGTTLSLKDMTFDNMKGKSTDSPIITNEGTMKIENATFSNNQLAGSYFLNGGVISNTGSITTISGEFNKNKMENNSYMPSWGASIKNSGTIGEINANFSENNITHNGIGSGPNTTGGSAIGNTGTITTISGEFYKNGINNFGQKDDCYTYVGASGGTIINLQSITNIFGQFKENYVISGGEKDFDIESIGGAISNWGTITNIVAQFDNNKAIISENAKDTYSSSALGGAIYNYDYKSISNIKNSQFNNNYVANLSCGAAQGGAIYNLGTIENIQDTTFSGNYAQGSNALGGAIYNLHNYGTNATIGITAATKDVTFSGNYVANADGSNKRFNDIYNNGGTINLNAAAEKKISFGGSIEGSNGILNINNLIYDTVVDAEGHEVQVARPTDGSVVFNDVVTGNQINLYNGTVEINKEGEFAPTALNVIGNGSLENTKINIQNGKTQTVKSINIKSANSNDKLAMDIDFFDRIEGNSNGGMIDIKTINLAGVKNCDQNVLTESLGQYIYNTGWSGAQLINSGSINAVGLSLDNKKATLTAYDTLSLESAIVNINKADSMLFTMDKNVELANAYTTNSIGQTPAYQLTINGKDATTGENHTISGTGIVVANNTTLDLADVTFSGMSAANKGDGGAINGNVRTIGAGTKFINNTAGVYDEETKTIITAGNGGAINGNVTEIVGTADNRVVFQGNKAYGNYDGGGMGAAINTNGTNIKTIAYTDFTDNGYENSNYMAAGTIYMYGNAGTGKIENINHSTFLRNNGTQTISGNVGTISNSEFSYNKSEASGVIQGNVDRIENSVFSYNQGAGGAAILGDIGTISGSEFSYNESQSDGGAIGAWYSDYDIESIDNTVFSNNKAGMNGGALFANIGTIGAGTQFINNTAGSGNGGAIYGSVNKIEGTADNHVVFQGNEANGIGAYGNDPGYGGAIYGGIRKYDEWGPYTGYTNIESIEYADFINNKAIGENYSGGYGGAIFGHIEAIKNSTFEGNEADGGGAYAAAYSVTTKIENSRFVNNKSGNIGGALHNFTGSVTDSCFEGNKAAWGGAIDSNSAQIYGNTTFKGNKASSHGGAIHDYNNIGIEINGNIIAEDGSIIRTGKVIFENNESGEEGGAISTYGACYIAANNIANAEFKGNTAKQDGGAIFGVVKNITDTTFTNNEAGEKGGAIYTNYASSWSTPTMYVMDITADKANVTFSGNKAKEGADIWTDGQITLNANEGKTISFDGGIVDKFASTDTAIAMQINNKTGFNGTVEFKNGMTVEVDKINLVAGKLDNAGSITGEVKVHDGANLVSSGNVGSILNSGNVQIAANAKITGNYSGYNGSSLDIQNGVLDTIKVATLEDSYLKFDVNLLSFESDKLNFNGASTGAHISFGEQAINLLAEMDEDVSIGKFQLATAGIITDKYTIASQDATYIFAESTVSDGGWINVTKDGGVSLSKYIQQLEEESAESGTKVEGQYDLKSDMYTTKDIGTLQLAGLILNGTENKKGITSEGKKGITLNGDDASLRVENLGHATGFVGGFVDNQNGTVTIANSNISGNTDVDIINNDLLIFEGNNNIGVVNNSGNAIVNSVKTEFTGGLNSNGSVVINENAELAFIGDATLEQNNVLVNKDGKLSVDNASKMNAANLTNEGEFNVNGGKITTNVNGEGNLNVNGDVTNEKIITNNVNIAENKSLQNDGTITGNTFNKGTLKSNVNNIQAVDNTGDYFVSGEGNIAAAITGQTGTTHIEENSNITNNNAVNIENAISISKNAKLTSNANNILNKVTLADNSSYNITGGKINAEIVGDGITNILENSTVALAETINLSGRVVAHNGSTFDIMNDAANTVSQFEVASGAKMNLNLDIEDKIDGTPTDGTINLAKINLAKAVAPGDRYQITDTLASNMKFSADTELLNKDENINFLTFSKDNGKGTIVALQTTLDKALDENNGDSAFFTMQDNEILSVAKAIGGEIGGNFVIDGKGNNIIGGGIIVDKNKTLEMKDANFVNASTEGSEDAKAAITVKGGSSASIIAQNSNVVITGTNNGKAVALESDGGNSKVTIEAKENQKVVLDDGITSDNKDNIVDFNGAGTIIFNGEFDNATSNVNAKVERGNYDNNISYNINEGGHLHYTSDLYLYDPSLHGKEYGLNSINMNGGALDLRNDAASRIELQELTVSTPSDLYLDVDLAALAIDNFGDTPVMASESGKLHIAGLNLVSDATLENTTISFTDNPTLMSITDYTGSDTVYAPVYKYNVNYNSSVGDFNFQKLGGGVTPDPTPTPVPYNDLNPGVMNSAVAAQVGAYSTVLSTFQESFSRMDMAMAMPLKERRAIRMRNKYSASGNVTTFDPNQFPEERQGIWFTPYTSYEKVDLKNGPNVENFTYGGLVGYDSKLIELKNGWDATFTGFAGYNGSRQAFDGVNSYLNGGTLGATAVFYKDNFFTGLTANVGASNVETTSPTAKDDFALLSAGIASKTGYNWELADGKFIIQPSLQLAYTFINAFDHTNSAGVRITSDPLNTIQIAPGIKFIGNLSNGWQPYAGIQMVWNIMDTVKSQADGINLPETSTRPYLQYGVGVQKHWGDRCTGYIQTGIRNGGRTGIAVSGGFRWALGPSPSDNTKKSNVNLKTRRTIQLSSF